MDYETTDLINLGHLKLLVQILEANWAKESTVDELAKKIEDIVNTGGEPNVIESIEVNGITLTITDKTVDIFVPTNLSDLTNDENFQTESEVSYAIEQAIAKSGHASFKVVDAVPTAEEAEENILYLVLNEKSECYDIYALIDGEIVLLDNTEVDLSDYVQKEEGKGLSSNDYTDEEKEKLSGIEDNANDYVHPTYTEQESDLYKITVDELGHISEAVEVEKSDITDLGIPAQDTTYEDATWEESGLMSVDDKIKLDDLKVATDEEVERMLAIIIDGGVLTYVEDQPYVTLTDPAEGPLESMTLYGWSTQDTTTGKNLFYQNEDVNSGIRGLTVSYDSDSQIFTIDGTVTGSGSLELALSQGMEFSFGTDEAIVYTWELVDGSITVPDGASGDIFSIALSNSDETSYLRNVYSNTNALSEGYVSSATGYLPQSSDDTYSLLLQTWCEGLAFSNAQIRVQIEKGSTRTDWEPYTYGLPSPNPFYPQEIKSAGDGGQIAVTIRGKNLVDCSLIDGQYTQYANSNSSLVPYFKELKQGKTYFYSVTIEGNESVISSMSGRIYVHSIKNGGSATSDNRLASILPNQAFTVDFDPEEVTNVYVYAVALGATGTVTLSNAMIELGSEVTDYESYREPQTAIVPTENGLPGIPVTSGGNYTDSNGQRWYSDELELNSDGTGTLKKYVYERTLDGSESWITYSYTGSEPNWFGFSLSYGLPSNILAHRRRGFCSSLVVTVSADTVSTNVLWLGVNNSRTIYAVGNSFYDDSLSDKGLSNWKSYLAETPMRFMTYYDEPEETELSADEVSEFLSLTAYNPTTVVTNDADAYMKVGYKSISGVVDLSTFSGIQKVVRGGRASEFFKIGDQLTCYRGDDLLTWDVIGIDHDTPADSRYTHSMTLQLHDTYLVSRFTSRQALYYTDDEMPAGTYYFTVGENSTVTSDIGKSYQFTIDQSIPAGGQLLSVSTALSTFEGASLYVCESALDDSTSTTVTLTEGSEGTYLGTIMDNVNGNFNAISVMLSGSNSWKESMVRQYLNSASDSSSLVWSPQTKFDNIKYWSDSTKRGFMSRMDSDFISVLGKVEKVTANHPTIGDGGTETTADLFWLPSRSEVYGGNESSVPSEGDPYPYYSTKSALSEAGTGEDSNRIKCDMSGSASTWWTRTKDCSANGLNQLRRVNSMTGALNSNSAANMYGLAPICCII